MRASDDARPARVVSVGRNAAWIVFDDEVAATPASIPKRLERLALVPGDRVTAHRIADGRAILETRQPRTFSLRRRSAGGREKTMAANVDTLVIVASFDRPPPSLVMVDEILAFAELHDVDSAIMFTKPDLAAPESRAVLSNLYDRLAYRVLVVNPKTAEGIDEVAAALSSRHGLLIGQSGVGKSSLFRALGGQSTVGDVSALGRGRQTTTSARLHRFGDGFLIDSPGVSDFALHPPEGTLQHEWYAEVAYGFREVRALVRACRFTDCTHRTEPDCAVRAATQNGALERSRYESYLFIVGREGGRRR